MNYYFVSIKQMQKMLANLDKWIEKSIAFAKEKNGFNPDVILGMRLAPDQYEFVKQVQSACDSAKFAAARLAEKDPPKHPDTETTMEELRMRIRTVVEYLGTYQEKDFAKADTAKVALPWAQGKYAEGPNYLVEMSEPNFYFHLTHAYAILRHAGVNLGKYDFMGSVTMKDL